MKLEAELVSPLTDSSWDEAIRSHPAATVFHHSAWARVLDKAYGRELLYVRCLKAGEPVAFIPMVERRSPLTGCRGVCLPYTDLCEPLTINPSATSKFVIDSLIELAHERGWKHFELRGSDTLEVPVPPAISYEGHVLDLRAGPRKLFSSVDSSVRRAIRKAEQHGLSTTIETDETALREFYQLHLRTRRRHGVPTQALSFYRNIQREMMQTGHGFIAITRRHSRPIAAGVYLHSPTKAVYKFGASDERLQEFRGNNLTMWTAIEHLSRLGVESLHFGRTARSNLGLRRYKISWGAVEKPIHYLRFGEAGMPEERPDRPCRFHTHVFRRLPLALNRLAGTLIYPHFD